MIYSLKEKTKEELEAQKPQLVLIKIEDMAGWRGKEWWTCDFCKVLFTPEEVVYMKEEDFRILLYCPRRIKKRKGFHYELQMCLNILMYANEAYWKTNYHLTELL